MNGRHKGESINGNNWNNLVEMEGKVTKGKKSVLEDMLKIIELTEECHRNPGKRPIMAAFASDTTLDGWRLSIRSTIDLTEELLNPKNPLEKYDFVLTAKWNQDALEVYICKKKNANNRLMNYPFLPIDDFWAHTFSRYTSNGCKFSTYYQDDVIVHTREGTIAERKCRK